MMFASACKTSVFSRQNSAASCNWFVLQSGRLRSTTCERLVERLSYRSHITINNIGSMPTTSRTSRNLFSTETVFRTTLYLAKFLVKAAKVDRKQEQALIEAAKKGDSKAFTELYRANVDQIYRYIYYRVFSVPVAEDLTSDVFIRALEGLKTYQDRSMPILAWLYRIAHARLVDHYRRARQSENDQDIESVQIGVDFDFDSSLMSEQQTGIVQSAVKTLNDEQQLVIVLRFVEGHNIEATAELMGKSISATKSLQYRAIQSLGRALTEQAPDLFDDE